jgi:hypothetical protein
MNWNHCICKCMQKPRKLWSACSGPISAEVISNKLRFISIWSRKEMSWLRHVELKGSQTVLGSSFVVSFLLRFYIFLKNRSCTKFFSRSVSFTAAVFNHRLYSGSRMARLTRVPAFTFSDLRVTSSACIVRIAKVAFPRIIGFIYIRSVRWEAVNAPTLNIT